MIVMIVTIISEIGSSLHCQYLCLYRQIHLCCFSVAKLCPTLCDPMDCSMPGSSVLQSLWGLLKFTFTESVMLSNHLILCCPFLLLPSFFPIMRVFSNESALCIMQPKYWSFSFSINPSSDYSGLISIRIDCFDLLAVQGTLKSLLQHLNSKASILQHSPFFKGNQSWIFIGRTDAEAEAPLFWPPDVKNWLVWKDPDAGKDWRQKEKRTAEDEMIG